MLLARDVHISTCPNPAGIVRAAQEADSQLCVVLAPERLSTDVYAAVRGLSLAADETEIAIVALTAARTVDADAVVVARRC